MPTEVGFKNCLNCKQELEQEDLFTFFVDSRFIDICKACLPKIDKKKLSEIAYSEDPFVKNILQVNRYLQCPSCHSNKIETEFVVLSFPDINSNNGVDGILICRDCFRGQMENIYKDRNAVIKSLEKHAEELTVLDVSDTEQATKINRCNELLNLYAPTYVSEEYKCRICHKEYGAKEMPYIIVYDIDEDGKVNTVSGKVCIECYRKLWKTASNRVNDNIYKILCKVLTKMSVE